MSGRHNQERRLRGDLPESTMITVVMTGGDIPVPTACPTCATPMEAYTATRMFTTPSPGDVSICGHCAALCIFTDELGLRPAGVDEIAAIFTSNPEIKKLVESMRAKRKK